MSNSSGRWLARHRRDPYVRDAKAGGYRSRAAYKLEELDKRCRLFRPGARVLDLGAAPGSWSQYASTRVGGAAAGRGIVIACDLLPIAPLEGVHIIEGDARATAVQARILDLVDGKGLDLVICDMAPNLSGVRARDQAEAMDLVDTALELAGVLLKRNDGGGGLVVKLFQGEGSEAWLTDVRGSFKNVRVVKPKASREASREVYVVAEGFKGRPAPTLADDGGNQSPLDGPEG